MLWIAKGERIKMHTLGSGHLQMARPFWKSQSLYKAHHLPQAPLWVPAQEMGIIYQSRCVVVAAHAKMPTSIKKAVLQNTADQRCGIMDRATRESCFLSCLAFIVRIKFISKLEAGSEQALSLHKANTSPSQIKKTFTTANATRHLEPRL